MKKYEKVLKFYGKAIEIDPNDKWAIANREEAQRHLIKERRG